jgi:hypothetical protein
MDKTLKRLRIASLSLGIIASCGMIYNLTLFTYLRPRVLNFEALSEQTILLGDLTALSLILIGVFHLCTVITLLLQITVQKSASTLKVIVGVIGIISGLLLLSDLALLSDIGKEYVEGWDTSSEWTILFINHSLHTLFALLAFPALMVKGKGQIEEIAAKDDVIFAAAHTTGLLCGGIGLVVVILALAAPLPTWLLATLSIPIGLLIILPSLLAVGVWLFMKRREKVNEWFDEKQLQDISRASLWTLALTLPCMIAVGIVQRVNGPGSAWDFVWLPLYIFLNMTLFSAATLYLLRR